MINQTVTRLFAAVAAISLVAVSLAGSSPNLLERTVELISSPNVAIDVKLTAGQTSERDKLFATFDAKRADIMRRMQSGSSSEIDARNAELSKALADLQDKLLALLTPTQQARLTEIGIQREGAVALTDDTIARRLGLTAAERSKIAEHLANIEKAQDDYQAALGEALSKVEDEKDDKAQVAKQAAVIQSMKPRERQFLDYKTAQTKQIYLLLTPTQRTKWDLMHGKKLKDG